MSKAAAVLAILIAAALGAYLSWAWPRLPSDVALPPLYEGPREEFAGILGAASALILALALGAAWRRPASAGLAPVAMALSFGFVHFALRAQRDPTLACVAGALGAVLVAFCFRAPKPKRVQPF